MKSTTLTLQSVEKPLQTLLPGAGKLPQGCVWFGEEYDRELWCDALNHTPCDSLLVKSAGYALRLDLIVGAENLHRVAGKTTRIIYLPYEGTSDKDLHDWLLQHASDAPYHFIRLFRQKDLGVNPGEASPLKQLWRVARAEFGLSPFLGLIDEDTRRAVREWLARIVVLASLRFDQPLLAEHLRHGVARADEVARVWSGVPNELNSKAELTDLLLLREYGRSVLDGLRKTESDIDLAAVCVEEYPYKLDSVAHDSCNLSGKRLFGVDFVINLGDELLPELQRLIPKLTPFAEQLMKSDVPYLKPLGEELKDKLRITTPMLALVGPFSSGKTTLLNILLMEKGARRAFRTANTANTAIISEINACDDRGVEQVKFVFREVVEHCLVNLEDGALLSSHRHNIRELRELIAQNVLEDPQLNCTVRTNGGRPPAGRGQPQIAGVEVVGRENVLRRLEALEQGRENSFANAEKVIFSAKVNAKKRAEVLGRNLPDEIDLSDDEGWKRFQGDGYDSLPFVEEVAASFLIQTADIRLRKPLLKLTTIADTPGTGSFNDRHDFVTDQFIHRAEGVILLLPTTHFHAVRVHRIIQKVRSIFVSRYKSADAALNNIAFVVNCYTRQPEDVVRQRVAQYEKSVFETFGLTPAEWNRRQSNPATANFFAVKLKNVEGGENPRRVYDRPSLTSLRSWIRRLFLSGRYRKRLTEIQNVLVKEWKNRRALLDESIREVGLEAKEMERRIAAVRAFRESELENTKRRYLEEIGDFKSDFATDADSIRKRIDRLLDGFVSDPRDKSRLGTLKEGLKGLYRELNERLGELEENDPAAEWACAMKVALAARNVDAPSLVPPDPQAQPIKWSASSRFDLQFVDQKFDEIEQKWPNWLERSWIYVKGKTVGGEDVRLTMAKELRDSFWSLHYASVWNNRLERYLQRSAEFIEAKTLEAKQKCLEREKALRELNETKKKELQKVVGVFDSFEAARKGFVKELETALNGGESK